MTTFPTTRDVASPAPFIVGVPRSGTTLLRFMLDAHPDVAIPQETHFLPLLFPTHLGQKAFHERFVFPRWADYTWAKPYLSGAANREAVHAIIVNSTFWCDFGLSAGELMEHMWAIDPFRVTDGVRCFYSLYAQKRGKCRWGDKTPIYGAFMAAIESLLPEAHFIHIVRDPRDVVLSHKGRKRWSSGRDIAWVANFWKDLVGEIRAQSNSVQHFMEIRYEDLLRETRSVLSRVCQFVALTPSPTMETYYDRAPDRIAELRDSCDFRGQIQITREQKIDNYRRATQAIDRSRIGLWKRELDRDEIDTIETITGQVLPAFGYMASRGGAHSEGKSSRRVTRCSERYSLETGSRGGSHRLEIDPCRSKTKCPGQRPGFKGD